MKDDGGLICKLLVVLFVLVLLSWIADYWIPQTDKLMGTETEIEHVADNPAEELIDTMIEAFEH